jgi:hypothetical protein
MRRCGQGGRGACAASGSQAGVGQPPRGGSPKGMRRWRGTTAKLTSCAGTQMVHRALQFSHRSSLHPPSAAPLRQRVSQLAHAGSRVPRQQGSAMDVAHAWVLTACAGGGGLQAPPAPAWGLAVGRPVGWLARGGTPVLDQGGCHWPLLHHPLHQIQCWEVEEGMAAGWHAFAEAPSGCHPWEPRPPPRERHTAAVSRAARRRRPRGVCGQPQCRAAVCTDGGGLRWGGGAGSCGALTGWPGR